MNRQPSRPSWIAGMVLAVLFALPVATTAAAHEDPAQGTWLVSTSGPTSNEVIWGRLVVRDGMLTFFAPRGEWKTPLSQVKRVSRAKDSDRSFEIETVNGEVLQLAILDPLMLTASPKKALQVIQRAIRETPRPVVSVATVFGTPR
jgi:hypothetical protein